MPSVGLYQQKEKAPEFVFIFYTKREMNWSCRASIPVPPPRQGGALPSELQPHHIILLTLFAISLFKNHSARPVLQFLKVHCNTLLSIYLRVITIVNYVFRSGLDCASATFFFQTQSTCVSSHFICVC